MSKRQQVSVYRTAAKRRQRRSYGGYGAFISGLVGEYPPDCHQSKNAMVESYLNL